MRASGDPFTPRGHVEPLAHLRRQLEDESRTGGRARFPRAVPAGHLASGRPASVVLPSLRVHRRGPRGARKGAGTSRSARRTCTGSPKARSPASSRFPSPPRRGPARHSSAIRSGATSSARPMSRWPESSRRHSRPVSSPWCASAKRWPSARVDAPSRSSPGKWARCSSGCAPPEWGSVVVAYEPVWAIGTGKNATPDDAAQVHELIRFELGRRGVGGRVPILYGGSVSLSNVLSLAVPPRGGRRAGRRGQPRSGRLGRARRARRLRTADR